MSTNRSIRIITQELWRKLRASRHWLKALGNSQQKQTHAQYSESIVRQVSHILNEIRKEHGKQREQRPDPGKGSIQQAGGKGGSGRRSLQKSLRGAGELPRWLRALAVLPQDPQSPVLFL